MSEQLIMRAAALARSSPQNWSEFLGEFRKHSDQVKERCISSPIDNLQTAQGRAQQCAADLKLLEEAVKTADQIAAKRSQT